MSSTKHLLDPELRAMADGPFLQNLNDAKVARVREAMADQVPALADPQPQGFIEKKSSPHKLTDRRCDVYFMAPLSAKMQPQLRPTCMFMGAVTYLGAPKDQIQ